MPFVYPIRKPLQAAHALACKPAVVFPSSVSKPTPAVLIGGGVGITPLVSMLEAVADRFRAEKLEADADAVPDANLQIELRVQKCMDLFEHGQI